MSLVNSYLPSLLTDDKCAVALFHYLDSGHISPQAHFLPSEPLQNSYPNTLVRAYFLYSGSRANVNMVNRTYLWRVPLVKTWICCTWIPLPGTDPREDIDMGIGILSMEVFVGTSIEYIHNLFRCTLPLNTMNINLSLYREGHRFNKCSLTINQYGIVYVCI